MVSILARSSGAFCALILALTAGCGDDVLSHLPPGDPPDDCAAGQEKIDGVCVAVCPAGQVRVEGICQTSCGPDRIRVGDDCVSPGAIHGRVCDETRGDWVSGAAVDLALADGTYRLTHTGSDGAFALSSVPPG